MSKGESSKPDARSSETQPPSFSVSALAEAAGVTVRTVRYYVAEGLMKEPASEGRYALYDEGHLNRIGLIQKLRVARLPLAVIRERLAGLTDDEERTILESAAEDAFERRRAAIESQQLQPYAGQSVADYVMQVLCAAEPVGLGP